MGQGTCHNMTKRYTLIALGILAMSPPTISAAEHPPPLGMRCRCGFVPPSSADPISLPLRGPDVKSGKRCHASCGQVDGIL